MVAHAHVLLICTIAVADVIRFLVSPAMDQKSSLNCGECVVGPGAPKPGPRSRRRERGSDETPSAAEIGV